MSELERWLETHEVVDKDRIVKEHEKPLTQNLKEKLLQALKEKKQCK